MRIGGRIRSRLKRLRPDTDGSVAIEYGILLPALLLFIFATIDTGQLFWIQTTLERAVAAAARCGAIDTINCATTTQIKNYAVAQSYGITVTTGAFTAASAVCGMQVNASYGFTPSIPLLGSTTTTLTAAACYPKPPS